MSDTGADGRLRLLTDLLRDADRRLLVGRSAGARAWPTGFPALDGCLAGGLRSGELTVLGGAQGVGKTTLALQVLRASVTAGNAAVHVSYGQAGGSVLEALVAIEAAELAGAEAVTRRRVRQALEASDGRRGSLAERLADTTGGAEAVRAVESYSDRLLVHGPSPTHSRVASIRTVVQRFAESTGGPPLVVVDYLQRVPPDHRSPTEEERVTAAVEGLKQLAVDLSVPVLAISAADRAGLVTGRRTRVHHLRGSSSVAHEPDVVLLLNEKYDVVARHHLVYDPAAAERFRNWVVLTIEKNRSGPDRIDLDLRKRFEQGRFDTEARQVAEQLVDDRVFAD